MPRSPESIQDIIVTSAFPSTLEDPLLQEVNEFFYRKKSKTILRSQHHGGSNNPFLRQMQETYSPSDSADVELNQGEERVIQSSGISNFILDQGKFDNYNAAIDEKRKSAAERGLYDPQSRFAGVVVDPVAAKRYHDRVTSTPERSNKVNTSGNQPFDPNRLMRMLEGADD